MPEWCTDDSGAQAFVISTAEGWGPPPDLELAWRVDGTADGRELVLPSSAAISSRVGRIAIVDFELGEIVVVSLDGDWIGRWGRRGRGPKEIGHVVAAYWREDGTLEVYDPANSKVLVFDSIGTAVGERPANAAFTTALGGGVAWISLGAGGTLMARPVATPVGEGTERQFVVLRADVDGSTIDTIARRSVPVVSPEGWVPLPARGWTLPHAAISSSGDLAVAGETQEYRVKLLEAGSAEAIRLCRQVDPEQVPGAVTSLETDPAIRAALETAPRPGREGAVGRVAFDEVDRLWVQRSLPQNLDPADGAIGVEAALFDVYQGKSLLGEIRLPPGVRFLGATEDLLIGLERNEWDEFSVVAYRPAW